MKLRARSLCGLSAPPASFRANPRPATTSIARDRHVHGSASFPQCAPTRHIPIPQPRPQTRFVLSFCIGSYLRFTWLCDLRNYSSSVARHFQYVKCRQVTLGWLVYPPWDSPDGHKQTTVEYTYACAHIPLIKDPGGRSLSGDGTECTDNAENEVSQHASKQNSRSERRVLTPAMHHVFQKTRLMMAALYLF
jgi:hypothetical protein